MTRRWPRIVVTSFCGVGTVAGFAAAEDVWVLWLRSSGGTYNVLSAGPTHQECLAVLPKVDLAPGESLRCLPKTVDPRESMEPRRPKGKSL
jgi:hypothetical protein